MRASGGVCFPLLLCFLAPESWLLLRTEDSESLLTEVQCFVLLGKS